VAELIDIVIATAPVALSVFCHLMSLCEFMFRREVGLSFF